MDFSDLQSPSNQFGGVTRPIESVAEVEAVDHNLIPDNGCRSARTNGQILNPEAAADTDNLG